MILHNWTIGVTVQWLVRLVLLHLGLETNVFYPLIHLGLHGGLWGGIQALHYMGVIRGQKILFQNLHEKSGS